MATVRVPIMSCPDCGQTFDVPQWRALDFADEQPKRETCEHRICDSCGCVLATDPTDLDAMDCRMDANHYAELFPYSELPALAFAQQAQAEAKNAKARLRIAAALAALVALAIAAYLRCVL